MRINVGVIGVCAVLLSLSASAELRYLTDAERKLMQSQDRKLTPEQRKEKLKLLELYYISEEGGDAIIPGTPKGKVLIVNLQKSVPVEKISSVVGELTTISEFDIRIVPAEQDAEMRIRLIEDPGKPTIAAFPDEQLAEVNVSRLADEKTNTKPAFLAARTRKSILRAFASLAAGSTYGTPLFGVVKSPADLDNIAGETLPVDIVMRAHKHLNALGLKPVERTSYRDALTRGYDIAPTNGYQKAIYQSVKSKK